MEFLDLKKELLELKKEINKEREFWHGINLAKIDTSHVHLSIVAAGNALFDETEAYYFDRSLGDIFNLHDVDTKELNQKDVEKALEIVFKKIDTFSLTDTFFRRMFNDNAAREKDRLRALTDGDKKILISKETEEEVITRYKEIFRLSLLLHFSFIDIETFYIKTIEHALPLMLLNGTFASNSENAFLYLDTLTRTISKDKKDVFAYLHTWYQENTCTFLEDKIGSHIPYFFDLHHLLNKEQKKKIIKLYKERLFLLIKSLKEKEIGDIGQSENVLSEIAYYLKDIEKLMLFEKDETNEA